MVKNVKTKTRSLTMDVLKTAKLKQAGFAQRNFPQLVKQYVEIISLLDLKNVILELNQNTKNALLNVKTTFIT